ncbi:MAG: GNAT family N-acetyltransferase [Bacilli bacterium]|nr:GNAT family N-acetyltransferase [Bacilli bacterium]
MKIVKTKDRTPQLIDKLLKVWENSVRATHKFLSNEEILEIKKYVPQALNDIAHLIIDTDENENPIAFIGIEGNKLEMLFIASEYRGKGIGKKMLLYGIENYKVSDLAVNEDNPQAKGFYEHIGFKVYKRNELDDQGKPYPVLYMRLEK